MAGGFERGEMSEQGRGGDDGHSAKDMQTFIMTFHKKEGMFRLRYYLR